MNSDVDEAIRRQFKTDGVVHLAGVLSPAELDILKRAFEWSIGHPGRLAKPVTPGDPGTFYGDLANPDSFGPYHDANFKTSLPALVSNVWGKPDVWFMYEQVFLKTAGSEEPEGHTPWHQDLPYLPVSGDDLAVVWISFEPLSREETLEFIAGSHRGTLYDGSRFDPEDHTAPLYGTGDLPRLPDIEASRNDYEIVGFPTQPGDVVIFHPAMLHGGAPTRAGKSRSTLSMRYFGEDATVALRPNDTDELLARIGSRERGVHPMQKAKLLGEGAPFRHELFPKVSP
ncbi:MAG: phytanoyl-CoA dioxygenase family protein [Proteobacteria bacterium]|nr:phytanoyl-CoA dioxygenase family protein [Pseudomonadota bacterium]